MSAGPAGRAPWRAGGQAGRRDGGDDTVVGFGVSPDADPVRGLLHFHRLGIRIRLPIAESWPLLPTTAGARLELANRMAARSVLAPLVDIENRHRGNQQLSPVSAFHR